MKQKLIVISLFSFCTLALFSQTEIPSVYSGMGYTQDGQLYAVARGDTFFATDYILDYHLEEMKGDPNGTENGIAFDFKNPEFNGLLYYGFIHHDDSRHPLPVFFNRTARIREGMAQIDILHNMSGKYDMIGWEDSGMGTMGYRVINQYGGMIYDGIISFSGTGPFSVISTVIEGPFINKVGPTSVTISFDLNIPAEASIIINDTKFNSDEPGTGHSIEITGLEPDTEYSYIIDHEGIDHGYSFKTAPLPGTRQAFTFAYASDSRSGQGGGERDLFGANYYIIKKIMAVSHQYNSSFMQFTGDLINGYLTDKDAMNLQYANWKRAIEPWAHYFPVYVGMGNHEAYVFRLTNPKTRGYFQIDRFPFATESAEALFRKHFVMPENGPESEDGAVYDPDPEKTDFPSYKESVFYYTYDNMAMIVLNSDYLFSPTLRRSKLPGGNLHGYFMDNQMKWLEETLNKLENDPAIDHIFVTHHTPAFPNGGHVGDDMWYDGVNDYRPNINGRVLEKGIIERRDEFLDLLSNKSKKTIAILTGDEHNYTRLKISKDINRYPENYFLPKIEISRDIYQINNGAAGAPYYAQEETPWSDAVRGFTTQNAVVFFHVDGNRVTMEVINPDTLEKIDEAVLRE